VNGNVLGTILGLLMTFLCFYFNYLIFKHGD